MSKAKNYFINKSTKDALPGFNLTNKNMHKMNISTKLMITTLNTLLALPFSANAQEVESLCNKSTEIKQCVENIKEGKWSKFIFPDGSIYYGQLANEKPNGQGIKNNVTTGSFSEGSFVDGKLSGRARLITKNGNIFEGEFENNSVNGMAVYKNEKGQVIYRGNYKNGRRDGLGKLFNNEGKLIAEGTWMEGKFKEGTYYYDEKKAVGEFDEKDRLHGKGKLLDNNDKLLSEGEWVEGKLLEGTIYYQDGGKYVGQLVDAKYHGSGKYFNSQGVLIFEGQYAEGKRVEGTAYYSDGSKYVGPFVNNKRHGKGRLYTKSGVYYDYEWIEDETLHDRILRADRANRIRANQDFSEQFGAQCESAIKNKYEYDQADKYGNVNSRSIVNLRYQARLMPGQHKYGNNNALLYVGLLMSRSKTDVRSINNLTKFYCVVNGDGKILGVERDYD